MHYRRMGDCGLKISAVSLGSWKNFGTGRVADDTVQAIIETAYTQGINFFDTRAGSFEHPFGFWGPEAAWKPSDRALSA